MVGGTCADGDRVSGCVNEVSTPYNHAIFFFLSVPEQTQTYLKISMPVFIYITYNEPPGSVWVRRGAFEIVLQQHTGPIQLELCSCSSPRSGPDARGSESTRPGPDAQCPQTRGAQCPKTSTPSRGAPSNTPCARPGSRDAAAICSHAASAPQLRTHVSVIPLYPIQTNPTYSYKVSHNHFLLCFVNLCSSVCYLHTYLFTYSLCQVEGGSNNCQSTVGSRGSTNSGVILGDGCISR